MRRDSQFLENILEFFFDAMLRGYVSEDVSAIPVVHTPGMKMYKYKFGSHRLLDIFGVGENYSAGQTYIWDKDELVWTMEYRGIYKARAIPFLKKILFRQYDEHNFEGGRGPSLYKDERLVYTNMARPVDFGSFRGEERIVLKGIVGDSNDEELGWHSYSGGFLVPL